MTDVNISRVEEIRVAFNDQAHGKHPIIIGCFQSTTLVMCCVLNNQGFSSCPACFCLPTFWGGWDNEGIELHLIPGKRDLNTLSRRHHQLSGPAWFEMQHRGRACFTLHNDVDSYVCFINKYLDKRTAEAKLRKRNFCLINSDSVLEKKKRFCIELQAPLNRKNLTPFENKCPFRRPTDVQIHSRTLILPLSS